MKGILILDIIIKEVEIRDIVEYNYFPDPEYSVRCEDKVLEGFEKLDIQHRVVPLHRFSRYAKPDMYIAVTKEIQELLGFPIDVLFKQIDDLEAQYNSTFKENIQLKKKNESLINMNVVERIKFLFRGVYEQN